MPSQPSNLAIERYLRAAHYLAAAQIYLRDNVLLASPLAPEHLKPRLLGHWGTCPGLNLIYAQLNRQILRRNLEVLLITGPGHGAPAILANSYLDGSLEHFYPELTRDRAGLHRFVRRFSWPGGFPSHLDPGVPGTIHEGGELGYALATAFGAALDNPHLLVACIIGDGEAETGPTAAAWHCPKFLDPAESGAVLPVLHLNGYKISNPTILGTMTDEALRKLFSGYGWEPHVVGLPDLIAATGRAMDASLRRIREIQSAARQGNPIAQPQWPLIILRSPKGWTGVKTFEGKPVEGSFRAHQVPIPGVHDHPDRLELLEAWLRSYHPEELFDDRGAPHADLLTCCPEGDRRMGCSRYALGGRMRVPLELPGPFSGAAVVTRGRGEVNVSPVELVAQYLARVIAANPRTFRLFSPDELVSNRMEAVFAAPTQRNYQWPVDVRATEFIGSRGGRVLEILSEHTCQAWLQGYLLTGRHGLFPSYEAFLNIVVSMMDQFAKFLKMSADVPWRSPVPSLTYLETSTLWRQEHNGFSHQNPGFINALLNKKKDVMRVYLPPDANCLLSTVDHCLRGTNHVNLIIANKQPLPVWLSPEEAAAHCRAGASHWTWAGTEGGEDPDVVLVGIGDVLMQEVIAAAQLLHRDIPELRVRVINVTDLLILARESEHPHGLSDEQFAALFTADCPLVFNFHGYPSAIEELLFGRPQRRSVLINGYREEGTTTTPFDMLVRNGASRYNLMLQAIATCAPRNPAVAAVADLWTRRYEEWLRHFKKHIEDAGEDPRDVSGWKPPVA